MRQQESFYLLKLFFPPADGLAAETKRQQCIRIWYVNPDGSRYINVSYFVFLFSPIMLNVFLIVLFVWSLFFLLISFILSLNILRLHIFYLFDSFVCLLSHAILLEQVIAGRADTLALPLSGLPKFTPHLII